MIRFQSIAETAVDRDITGQNRIVLLGDIVIMNTSRDVLRNGRLCLESNVIAAVLAEGDALPPAFADATQIDTQGTIYPGLFDLHNHLPYNMIPLWQVDRRFENRRQWQAIPEYYPAVRAPFSLLNEHPDVDYRRAIVRFTECRNLLGGVTTGHGMGLTRGVTYQGLMRNVEQPLSDELPQVKSQTADMKPDDIQNMMEWTGHGRAFIYHLSEGVDDYAHQRFMDLKNVPGALNPGLVCIHAVGVRPDDFLYLKTISGIVWSPTSNLLLYGRTCQIEQAKQAGIPIAIGADWSASGCKNLLGELKVARAVSRHLNGTLSDMELVAGVTCVPAKMIGWDQRLGSIEAGKWADLLVVENKADEPYGHLIEAQETSISAVIIGGRVRLGQAQGFVVGDPMSSEEILIGGKHYVLDLAEPGGDGIGGVTLGQAIAKIDDGLRRLSEFETAIKTSLWSRGHPDMGWQFEDEMHEDTNLNLMFTRDDHPRARPMRLAPMTAVDDHEFAKQIRDSLNMPDYAKAAF